MGKAARRAHETRDAEWGVGFGLTGTSFAIPTKDWDVEKLPIDQIEKYVGKFLKFARARPDLSFELTPIGCGPESYSPEQMAPLFGDAPPNVILPNEFRAVLELSAADKED